jgi:glycerol-3-phosphate dehydrogenase
MKLKPVTSVDLLIVGGGINGLAVAAAAAVRGLQVLLVERRDLGSGTTGASSRLIHGGLRYLRHLELGLVRESLRERGRLVRTRPHLVRPLELLIPLYPSSPGAPSIPPWQLALGLALYDCLARDPLFSRSSRLSPMAVRAREPDLAAQGLAGGFLFADAQLEFPERLCVELALEASSAGALVRTHCSVMSLTWANGRVSGAVLRDELTGAEETVEARVTLNAAGPWVDAVNASLPNPLPRLIGGTWGTHLVLPLRNGGPRGALYTQAHRDGRPIFLLPWDGRLLMGTTDVPFHGHPDSLRMEDWETEYLLAELNTLYPDCAYRPGDVIYTTIGIRPLPRSSRGMRSAGAITRRHFVVDHARRHGIPGLFSLVGGKLTTHASLAEEAVAAVCRTLGHSPGSSTPAASARVDLPSLQREALATCRSLHLDAATAYRLVRLYGSRYRQVLEYVRSDPAMAGPLAPGSAALRAEVYHAAKAELARTAEDVVCRRLMRLPPTEEELREAGALLATLATDCSQTVSPHDAVGRP